MQWKILYRKGEDCLNNVTCRRNTGGDLGHWNDYLLNLVVSSLGQMIHTWDKYNHPINVEHNDEHFFTSSPDMIGLICMGEQSSLGASFATRANEQRDLVICWMCVFQALGITRTFEMRYCCPKAKLVTLLTIFFIYGVLM